jgi:hypothetical protein
MATSENNASLILQFAENLKEIPNDLINGILASMEDEDGKKIVAAYSATLMNQFHAISKVIQEAEPGLSRETKRQTEELLKITSGVQLTNEVKNLCDRVNTPVMKIGLAGIIQMVKKIIKWVVENILKTPPKWLNKLIDLIDEIINEVLGIGSPKLATVLSIKEQNYLSELTRLAILNREERYLFNETDEEE